MCTIVHSTPFIRKLSEVKNRCDNKCLIYNKLSNQCFIFYLDQKSTYLLQYKKSKIAKRSPGIFFLFFAGAASLNAKMNGMIALRTIIYFLVTSLISALLGLAMVLIIHPGNPETKTLLGDGNTAERKVDIVDNFLDLGRNLFPDNLFQASFQTVNIIYF